MTDQPQAGGRAGQRGSTPGSNTAGSGAAGAAAASSTPPSGSATPQPPQRAGQTGQDLNRIVLEYLNKKGYTRTEAMLRVESSRTSAPMNNNVGPNGGVATGYIPPGGSGPAGYMAGRHVTPGRDRSPQQQQQQQQKTDPMLCMKGFDLLKEWVDTSLELYRPELRRVLYPLFIHVFLELVSLDHATQAREFFDKYAYDFEVLHGKELQAMSSVSLPLHLQENSLCKQFLSQKYRIYLNRTTLDLVLYFLHEIETFGGSILIRILNQRTETHVTDSRPLINEASEYNVNPNEGITGVNGVEVESFNAKSVKLGKMPVDKELQKDVIVELEKEQEAKDKDNKEGSDTGDVTKTNNNNGQPKLVDTYKTMIKVEDDSPDQDAIPLPKYKKADIDREVLKVIDAQASLKLSSTQTPLPSVCMYTFHNTHDSLNTVEFSDDNSLIAGGFSDSFVKIWSLKGSPLKSVIKDDPNNGHTVRRLVGHAGPVYGLSFSPDSRFLLSSSEDKTVRLWSMDTYTALVSYKGHNHPVWDVAFSPLGHYFATASHDQTARLWSCDHIYPLRIFAGHLSDVDCVVFHPNGTYVFTGSSDRTIRMWDINKGNAVRVFMGHTTAINCMAVSPDGRWLASAGDDSVVNVWDIGSGKRLKCMRGHGRAPIYSLAFSKDGAVLVSGGSDCSVRVWDIRKDTNDAGAEPEKFGDLANGASANGGSLPNGGANTAEDRRRKEIQATNDHMAVFFTKRTPVYRVGFTPRNVCLAAGAFLG